MRGLYHDSIRRKRFYLLNLKSISHKLTGGTLRALSGLEIWVDAPSSDPSFKGNLCIDEVLFSGDSE